MKIYSFNKTECLTGDDVQAMKDLLGGKGYGLHEMCAAGMPVPPGFTLTTEWSVEYNSASEAERKLLVDKAMDEMQSHVARLTDILGYTPLLSVRSGAPVSMPGMMDTILNVGISDETIDEVTKRYGIRTALDSYRRLIQMMGITAFDLKHEAFEAILTQARNNAGVQTDAELDAHQLSEVVDKFRAYFEKNTGMDFPQDRMTQIRYATIAVFESWSSDRAIHYRKMEGISDSMGTAVNIQAMVFGNMNDRSGTGVFFTRNPTTGEKVLYGEYLPNAQGEDVVAGIRTPIPVLEMAKNSDWSPVLDDLHKFSEELEDFYGDMVDGEFTVEDGVFYLLQSRTGKRTPTAALQIAVDLIKEGRRNTSELPKLIKQKQYLDSQVSIVDPSCNILHDLQGIPACPGVVTGKAMFSAEAAVACKEPCILMTKETTPDDIAGMDAAVGILTAMGGATSHAAVVARAMNRPCVVGATELSFDGLTAVINAGTDSAVAVAEGDIITICGLTGRVWVSSEIPVIDLSSSDLLSEFNSMALGLSEDIVYGLGLRVISSSDYESKSAMAEAILEATGNEELAVLDIRSTPARLKDLPHQDVWFKAMGYTVEEPTLDFSGFNLSEVIVLSENKDSIKSAVAAGAKAIAEANTVNDLITGKGTYMTPAMIKTVFGTESAFSKVKKALNLSIMDKVEPVPVKIAVMNVLGDN